MQMHSDFIGTAEAVQILGVDRATLTRWVKAKKIASHKMPGKTGAYLFSRADVVELSKTAA